MDQERLIVRPAVSAQVLMACFGVPFLILGVAGPIIALTDPIVVHGQMLWTVAGGVFSAGLGGWLVLEVSTVRLHLSADKLWLSRYWHTRWVVERNSVEVRTGKVGDGGILPGLHVLDRRTGRKVGEIITGQFNAKDLKLMQEMLKAGDRLN